jgi:hypothetical protein
MNLLQLELKSFEIEKTKLKPSPKKSPNIVYGVKIENCKREIMVL